MGLAAGSLRLGELRLPHGVGKWVTSVALQVPAELPGKKAGGSQAVSTKLFTV